MTPKLYYDQVSPPSRSVLMCAKHIGLDLEVIHVNVYKGEHLKSELIKINPLHKIPTVEDDDGFVVSDSHAIMAYLVGKYAKDKSLYPEDLRKRAIIDQRLHFDSGVLFARHGFAATTLRDGAKTIPERIVQAVNDAYRSVEFFLQDSKYVAGDTLSIADFSILNSMTNANVLIPVDEAAYPNIAAWKKRLETLPYYEIARVGGEIFKSTVSSILSK